LSEKHPRLRFALFAATQTIDEQVGLSRRLRLPVTGHAAHHQRNRGFKINPMTGGHKYEACMILRSERSADDFALINERGVIPGLRSRLFEAANEKGLGTTDSRKVEQETQMTGKPHPAGMRQPLTIKHNGVRLDAKLFKSL
jgi:hypothetical protein